MKATNNRTGYILISVISMIIITKDFIGNASLIKQP